MGLFDIFKGGAANANEVSHDDLVAALQAKAVTLIDVREPNEFASGHVQGASNLPLSRFDAQLLPSDKAVVLICRSGARSGQALAKAHAAGRSDVRHYRGGVMGWSSAGGKLV
jgi:rhodanese-related sulfurtransferase